MSGGGRALQAATLTGFRFADYGARCPRSANRPVPQRKQAASGLREMNSQSGQDDPGPQHEKDHYSNGNDHWFHRADARHAR